MNRKYFSASLLLILLLLVMPFSLGGCSKDSPKRAVKKELNLIKELDESTIKAFVSYEDMMSSHSSSSDVGIETTEAVKRFFQNFDYKIKSSSVEDKKATVHVEITNLDMRALAKDICLALVKKGTGSGSSENMTLNSYFALLGDVLSENTYDLVTTEADIKLLKTEDGWMIQNTDQLEDDLVSGFITYLKDPYLVTPEELKCSTYRIEEVKAPEGFVRQGSEESLYDGTTIISPLEQTTKGTYKENPQSGIVITVSSNTAHQIDPDTGAAIVEVEQKNDEQVGSLLLTKKGEQLTEVTGDSVLAKVKALVSKVRNAVSGKEETGIYKGFKYEETGVEGAQFEVYAKDTIYSPDGAKDEEGNPVVRYEKDDLVAKLTTDENGTAVIYNLPLGTYYLKEVVAGENFVLNTEQKEFTLTAEDDTQAVVYEGVTYKNERQKVSVSVEKKDSVTGEKLEGVIFGLYAAEDILSNQGEVLVEKDTLLEKKATDAKGILTFDSDLPHGKYYVKEEVRKAGYLPNEEVWNVDATYENQNLAKIELNKEVENQPTETRITKTDATTGNELEGAKLQVIDKDGTVVEEWTSTKEEHVIYGLPEGSYTLHEELAPYEDGYVSASDVMFEVKEDGSVTKVEMKDEYSKVEISKTDLTTGKELEGAKLQIIRKDGTVLEEWITDGKPHSVAKLPVNEELTLREITAPDGYEIAEDVTFTLKDTMEVQKVEMKDARTPEKTTEKTNAPKTGDNQKIWAFVLLALASAGIATGVTVYRRKKSKMTDNKEETEEK